MILLQNALKRLAENVGGNVQPRKIQLLDYLPSKPLNSKPQHKKKQKQSVTELELRLQNEVDELKIENESKSKTIREQKIHLMRTKDKLKTAKQALNEMISKKQTADNVLKNKLAKTKKLLRETESKWQTAQNQLITMKKNTENVSTSTETVSVCEVGVQTNLLEMANESVTTTDDDPTESTVQPPFEVDVPSHAKSDSVKPPVRMFKCRYCGKDKNKESHLLEHENEYCKKNPNRNEPTHICFVCKKPLTYRRLYDHLRGLASGLHKPRGIHAGHTPEEYQTMLVDLMNKQ